MTRQQDTIRVVLGFDMETDIGSWTPFYEGLVHGTPRVLDLLRDRDVRATFFFTGDAAKTHPGSVRDVVNAGQEVGCHSLYHETVGDAPFPIPGIKPLLPQEVAPRLELATRWVEEAAGMRVTSFRAPRLWGSTAMVNALVALGYTADASYPLYLHRERLAPYRPSAADWTREGDLPLLEIPNFADMTMESRDPHGRDRDQWPLFRTKGAAALMRHVDAMLGLYRERGIPPVICFYLHPWEFHPMPQGEIHYGEGAVRPDSFIVQNCGEPALVQLACLIDMFKERGAAFLTACDLAGEWGT